ncbi:MAG: FtsB family cell division protein [Dysgonomonas sp.]
MKAFKPFFDYLFSKFTKIQLIFIVVLIVCAFIISDSNVFARIGYNAEIRNLNNQIDFYRKKTEKDKRKLDELHSNKEDIEKFARENYFMKNENEDIFIIE